MAHIHIIEDEKGNAVDQKVYCSDLCHRHNCGDYEGWNGCHEISFTQFCEAEDCEEIVKGLDVSGMNEEEFREYLEIELSCDEDFIKSYLIVTGKLIS